jgi:zinc transporter 2
MTDAAHLLTDVAAMLLSLFAMHLAGRPANKTHSFGYHRAEILGALTSIVTIWGLVAILVYEAILRLYNDSRLVGDEVDGRIMTIIGIAGFFVNIIDAGILHWGKAPHGHSHSHGHDHGHGHGDVNVRAAFIHVLGDCLQSVGVVVAALVIWIGNQLQFGSPRASRSWWNLADPIASLIFSVITLFTTVQLCKKDGICTYGKSS